MSCLVLPLWGQVDHEVEQQLYGKGKMPYNDKGEVVFSKVIQEEGADKAALYNAAKLCLTDMFRSAKDVIQLDDKESGIIIIKGFTEEPSRGMMGTAQNAQIWFSLKIQAKDGRYKIDIYKIYGHYPGGMVNGIYLSPNDTPAEMLTYDLCFKPNGKMKTKEGFYRRAIIDCCNRLLLTIASRIKDNLTINSTDASEDW